MKQSTVLDNLMIVGVILLVISPLLFWLYSPVDWEYGRALELQRQGELDQAREIYQKILQGNPDHGMAAFRLGELFYRGKEFEKALVYGRDAYAAAQPYQKPAIINLISNALVVLEKPEEAVQVVKRLHEFTTLPREFDELDSNDLLPFMATPSNRQFLNSLAYTMAVSQFDLQRAETYINAVIGYYEQQVKNSRLTAAYLYERSSNYQEAFDVLNQQVTRIESQASRIPQELLGSSDNFEDSSAGGWGSEFRQADLDPGSGNTNEKVTDALVFSEKQRELLFLAYTRLKLLSEKLEIDKGSQYPGAIERLRSPTLNEKNCRLELNDEEYFFQANEFRHYYDTRAMVRLSLGNEFVKRSIDLKGTRVSSFLRASAIADAYYQAGYRDLQESFHLNLAMEAYLEKFPENSLMITLASDSREFDRESQRIEAIECYHQFLFLTALDQLDEAQVWLEKIHALGYEASRALF